MNDTQRRLEALQPSEKSPQASWADGSWYGRYVLLLMSFISAVIFVQLLRNAHRVSWLALAYAVTWFVMSIVSWRDWLNTNRRKRESDPARMRDPQ